MTRQEAIQFLKNRPAKYAHLMGFDKLSDMHNDWIREMVIGREDKTLQSHRESYKTTCVSVALTLIIILLPNYRTMFMRKTDADVKEVVRQVQKMLQDPHTLYFVQAIYGVNLKLNVASTLEVQTNLTTDSRGTSQLVGMGSGASITGKHFERIFTDDIVNVNDRVSKAERERTKLIYQELQNVKNKEGGRIFNTGTPWHEEDCFTIMPNPDKYNCYTTGIISKENLAKLRRQMLPSLFACNYELEIIASEDVIFRDPQTGYDQHLAEQGISHVDAGYGGGDYTALTIAKKKDGKLYVFGKCWQKNVEELEDDIKTWHDWFMSGKMYNETNADKGFLIRDLKKKGIRMVPYHENMNKHLKICTWLVMAWKDVCFVEGTDPEYIKQICDYTEEAEHDDCPDSLSSLIRVVWNKSEEPYQPVIFRQGG